jgi:23S rRNA (adenine1618-N6)-methyltransferase
MMIKNTKEKTTLHPRNQHRFRYDFDKLTYNYPLLKNYIFINEHDSESSELTIDFANPEAVKALNKAILITDYGIQYWDIPKNYLCPPIPSRADYIHYIADLLAQSNDGTIPLGENVIGLDIGIGSNCIYPIIGNHEYNWSFVGTDIDENAIQNCKKIIAKNPHLIDVISLQLQTEPRFIFKNIMLPEDKFAFIICNPPFHNSQEQANKSSLRKVNNLTETKSDKPILNFGGVQTELWCNGGEIGFITQMIYESVKYPLQVFWFTTLVSKKDNLRSIYKTLNKVGAVEIKTIDMEQGQKISRFVAWTFLSKKQQNDWDFSI